MSNNWLMDEFERARKRSARLSKLQKDRLVTKLTDTRDHMWPPYINLDDSPVSTNDKLKEAWRCAFDEAIRIVQEDDKL